MKKQLSERLVTALLIVSPFVWMACGNSSEADHPHEHSDSTGAAQTSTTEQGGQTGGSAMATLSGTKPDTTVNGTVQFTQDGDKVKLTLQINVPKKANQSVALHFHEHADCGDMGKHAGGHWNPTGEAHGKWGEDKFHSGDIGNIDLDGNGEGKLEVSSDRWSIGGDAKKDILNKTIIVHSGVDDYKTQPSGNSGERIGCGVIKRGNQ
jgi:Cu-Zn family superoxide dismutase